MLSPHLSVAEFLRTTHEKFAAEQAAIPGEVLARARRHATELWEPARALVGPMAVSSGWRCQGLNAAVGGSKGSAHLTGDATDNTPLSMHIVDAMVRIARSALPFDQLILEQQWSGAARGGAVGWIHLGSPRGSAEPRRQALMRLAGYDFEPFRAGDPRVRAIL